MNSHLELFLVGGPNGSGKSTFAEAYFSSRTEFFINPDLIAAGISPTHVQSATVHAARVMIQAITEKIEAGQSFAFESTLAGKTWLRHIKRAKERDYKVTLYFVYLEKVSKNLERIKKRVQEGGHNIPKVDVERRFLRSFENFWTLYRPLADDWYIFNNSGSAPKQVMNQVKFEAFSAGQKQKWLAKTSGIFK